MSQPLRLQPSAAVKEKRLATLLEERGLRPDDPALAAIVEDAQLLGSLELAGVRATWDEVRSSRTAGEGPAEVLALRRARRRGAGRCAVQPRGDPSVARGARGAGGLPPRRAGEGRRAPRAGGVRPEPSRDPRGVAGGAGSRDLKPEQGAAVALARIVEIAPFDDGNGRVSRLAASHLMVRGGLRPPILVAGDAPRLRAALESAFRLETEPLVLLLVEASGRALDVMIQSLSAR